MLRLVALAVLVATLGGAAVDAAQAADPAGPELFSNCFWTGPRGRDFHGGAHDANNYPDADATYWFARFVLPAGSHLEITGTFPHARYMSFSSYATKEPSASVHDTDIAPDPGSTNPFLPGARRDAAKRSYTMSIVAAARPSDPAPNTYYAGADSTTSLVYRVYTNDRGTDVAGGEPLPAFTLVGADGSRVGGEEACARINTVDHDVQTSPPTTLEQWEDLIHTPGLDPAVAPARRRPFFERFFNAPYNFIGDFRPETRAGMPPTDGGGAFSNADTRYIYAAINRRFGPVMVLRGKLPTFPATQNGETVMGTGELRYWSICTNETPVSGRAVDCASDFQVRLAGDRRYRIVVSRRADRPRNAVGRCGVTWLDWGAQTEVPEQPGYGLIIVRNMLADPGFAHAAQSITELGTERRVMGPYYPSPAYTTRARFEALGCRR
jgi:hypothetical protein